MANAMTLLNKRIQSLSLLVLLALTGACSRETPEAKRDRFLQSGKKQLEKHEYAAALIQFKNASQAMPKDAEPYYQLAIAQMGMGDLKKGYQLLKKAIELNPNHVEAKSRLAELLAANGNSSSIPEAQKAANEVLALSPDNPEALNALALSELRLGNQHSAEEYLDRALGKFPQDLKIAVLLAKVKITNGDLKGAEQVLKDEVQHNPGSADSLVALGNFYAVSGRPADAVRALESALKVKPQYPLALFSLAEVQDRLGQKAQAEEVLHQLANSQDPQYEPLYGIYLFQVGKRDAALKEFERLQRKNPKDRASRSRLVQAYLVMNRISDAEHLINAVIKENSKDSDALVERASLYFFERKYREVQADLEQALRFKPDSVQAHFLLATLHKTRGFVLGERQELTEALKINPGLLQVRLELATNLLGQSPKNALEVLDKAPSSQTRQPAFIAARNRCLIVLGRDKELQRALDGALKVFRTPELLAEDGILNMKYRRYDAARSSFTEALHKDPKNGHILDALAETYMAQNRPKEALAMLRDYASKNPKSPRAQQLLGAYLQRQGQLLEARSAFMAAKQADPQFVQADLALGLLDVRESKFEDARVKLEAVVASRPDDASALFFLASVEENLGNYSAAIQHYRTIVALEPENLLSLNNLAYDLADHANQPAEALTFAQKAKELAPSDMRISDTLGWVLYRQGVYGSAISQLEEAAASNNAVNTADQARIQYHLAMAYFKSGKARQGEERLESAMRLAPNIPEARLAQEVRDHATHP
jgi:tetratricopeptide (TPR) repeat protein